MNKYLLFRTDSIADNRKARKILKWSPKISFKSLVHEMVDHDLKNTK